MRLTTMSMLARSASSRSASSLAALREALFPPVCPGCATDTGTGGLCPACWREIAFLHGDGCRHCARPIAGLQPGDEADRAICDECLRWPPAWDRGRAAFRYEGTGRRLVLGLKHGDRLDLVPMLGGWMLRAGGGLVDRADLIAPVPLHWTRRLKRRANQSAELARWLARARGRPGAYAPRLLLRTRRTPVQDGKGREARVANVDGAFALGPDAGGRGSASPETGTPQSDPEAARPGAGGRDAAAGPGQPAPVLPGSAKPGSGPKVVVEPGFAGPGTGRLAGRRVLLVDDVLTTGATLNAAARLCRAAGAVAVDVLVLSLVMREEFAYLPASPQDEDADDEAD